MKQRMLIEVRGKTKLWSFPIWGEPEHLAEWESDGLQVFFLENTIPEWAVDLGLTRLWCAVQDVWRWMRLW